MIVATSFENDPFKYPLIHLIENYKFTFLVDSPFICQYFIFVIYLLNMIPTHSENESIYLFLLCIYRRKILENIHVLPRSYRGRYRLIFGILEFQPSGLV